MRTYTDMYTHMCICVHMHIHTYIHISSLLCIAASAPMAGPGRQELVELRVTVDEAIPVLAGPEECVL